jgi:hypothetical protein
MKYGKRVKFADWVWATDYWCFPWNSVALMQELLENDRGQGMKSTALRVA